jgi:ribosome-binding factor A
MKYMPDIRFKEDHSLERGIDLYDKLNKLESKNKEVE